MPARGQKTSAPKQVVYLWGAGATQAEISYLGAHKVSLLMRDSDELGPGVANRILEKLPERWKSSFVVDRGTDIEKLISLLAASNVATYHRLADTIRKLYFEDIVRNLATAKVLENPQLAIGLLTLHGNHQFRRQEMLSGIITTNHDGLLQVAAQRVHAQVNIGIPFRSKDFTPDTIEGVPLLHLHGSFTWTFDLPIKVSLLHEASAYSRDTVWIPPTILKESKNYPFNKLAGIAYELLSKRCDVLRVVGSALTQNDWNVLSMIFNAQRHRELTNGTPFRIELIMHHKPGVEITQNCSYLKNLFPIGYLTDGDFDAYKDEDDAGLTSEMKNPLFYWMKQKIQFHQNQGQLGAAPIDPATARITGDIP